MKLVEMNLNEFNNEIDSSSPAPGGGSVSALASSIGVSLTRMVGHLTISKKKFRALDIEVQNKFNTVLDDFLVMKSELIFLVDEDTEAFNLIMKAFKLPKETDEDKKIRKAKILEGTIEAIKVPYIVAKLSYKALKNMEFILKYGNKNALSDIGVSTLMLYSGLEGAILNVKINIPGLTDQHLIDEYQNSVSEMLLDAKNIKDLILEKIHNLL
jgi:formiminotetrahydrofolate cyclodeaminase